MLRNLAEPVEGGGFGGGLGIEASGDGSADQGGALLFEQGKHALFLGDQCIDSGGFAVEVGGDVLLGLNRRNWDMYAPYEIPAGSGHFGSKGGRIHLGNKIRTQQEITQVRPMNDFRRIKDEKFSSAATMSVRQPCFSEIWTKLAK